MDKKRILYVITKSNFGGAQRYVFELAEAMQEAGHRVAVASAPEGELVDKLHEVGIKHYPIKNFQRDVRILKEWQALKEIKNVIKEFKPEIVHLNSSKAGVLGAAVARLEQVPKIIFTAHGWPYLEPRNWLWKSMAYFGSYLTTLLSHKIILVSMNDQKNTFMPLIKNKLVVIKNGVSKIDFIERSEARKVLFDVEVIEKHKNDIWLVTNAELNKNKNIQAAISAVAEYNKTNNQKIFYTIIGNGELRDELMRFISEKNANNFVCLYGYLNEARNYLKAFDIFILPSFKEGMPYAVVEAGLSGLPIAASMVGGIPEIIDDQKNGLLFKPAKQKSIVGALEKIIEPNNYGLSLQNKILTEFSLDTMINKTQSVYL